MGLDMYLEKKIYLGGVNTRIVGVAKDNYFLTTEEAKEKVVEKEYKNIKEFVVEVAYLRKANAIHKWFVDNVQDGEDDCKEYWVSKEKMKTLVKLCKKVLENPSLANELLPTQSGFFFGSTEYDEWYFKSLENTIMQLQPIIDNNDEYDVDYYYSASW